MKKVFILGIILLVVGLFIAGPILTLTALSTLGVPVVVSWETWLSVFWLQILFSGIIRANAQN